jgi:hypothetical protein
MWHGPRRLRDLEERFLYEVQGVVATRHEPASDAVQAVSVRVEQGGQPSLRLTWRWGTLVWLGVHTDQTFDLHRMLAHVRYAA